MRCIISRTPVPQVAATGRPDMVDPALMRPGRFDKICYCGPGLGSWCAVFSVGPRFSWRLWAGRIENIFVLQEGNRRINLPPNNAFMGAAIPSSPNQGMLGVMRASFVFQPCICCTER